MGKIKKILENELVGGTQSTDVYPVTSTKAVYDENNKSLDAIIKKRGILNISTLNNEETPSVLTLTTAIANVPLENRVFGFLGTFLINSGWVTYRFDGESISEWSNLKKWSLINDSSTLAQESGTNENVAMSQKAVTDHLTKLENNNPYFFEDKKLGFIIQGVETDTEWDYMEVYQYANRNTTAEYYSQLLGIHAYLKEEIYDFSVSFKEGKVKTSKETYELISKSDNKIKVYVDWGALQSVSYALLSPPIKINNALIKVGYKSTIEGVKSSLNEKIDNVESSLSNKISNLTVSIMYNYIGEVTIV